MSKKKVRKPVRAKRAAKRPAKNAPAAAVPHFKWIGELPRLGEAFPNQGGNFAGLVKGPDGKPDTILIAADPKHWPKGVWDPRERVAGADSLLDGMANTKAMAAAGNATAKKVLGLTIDGHSDFAIAAPSESALVHANGCGPKEGLCWTSRQSRNWDDGAWVQDFSVGYQSHYHEGNEFPFVLVRRLTIR